MKTQNHSKCARWVLFTAFLFGALGLFLAATKTANAMPRSDIAVSTTLDESDPNDGQCSLREATRVEWSLAPSGPAVGECPAGAGNDNIILPDGTFILTDTVAGPIRLFRNTFLTGASAPGFTTTIEGGAGWNNQVVVVDSGANTSLWHVTIRGGNSVSGGGILQSGMLDLAYSIITNNHASGMGGGIYNTGILTITNSTIQLNTANGAGGLYNNGAGAHATLNNTNILTNTVSGGAGGIYNFGGTMSVTGGNIISNTTQSAFGGGISNDSTRTVSISGTVLSRNTALNGGGGFFSQNSSVVSISNTTIDGNLALVGAGIFYGGTSSLTVNASAITNNTAGSIGGGIFTSGPTVITNTTISSNRAGNAGGAGVLVGGSVTTINYSTVIKNQSTGSTAGLRADSGIATYLRSTIVALNQGGSGFPDCFGTITSWGFNLIGNNQNCTFGSIASDLVGTPASPIDPRISSLGNHGGPTQTHALLAGSPALSVMSTGNNGCGTVVTTDQRGFPRPRNGKCNIGAFEGMLAQLYMPLLQR